MQMSTSAKMRINTKPKASQWFGSGERLPYSLTQKQIATAGGKDGGGQEVVHVWNRRVVGPSEPLGDWITMMPGFPDGSFGWASTDNLLGEMEPMPRLYVEYVGMGDSDKPEGYDYSVMERADLVAALWRHHGVKRTLLVTFDFSSLVALELLSRQILQDNAGLKPETYIEGVLFINGGLFADAHSHPIMTTPLLKTSLGRMGARFAQNSKPAFNMMMKDLWSREYKITKAELAENHEAISRRGGTVFMSNAAGFVDEHRGNAERWDLGRIFATTFPRVKYIVAGSEKDQFEPRQVRKARSTLEPLGLKIDMYPGGHMTTSEHPDLIVNSIQKLKSITSF